MKIRISAITFVLVASGFAETFRVGGGDGGLGFSGYGEGKQFNFWIKPSDLDGIPSWKDDQENPPLSPRKAEKLAIAKLENLLDNPTVWRRADILLHQTKYDKHWLYVVEFERDIGSGTQPPRMRVVVLMDGTIPKITILEYPNTTKKQNKPDMATPRKSPD